MQRNFFFSLASWLTSLLQPAQAPAPAPDGRTRRDLPLLQVGVAAGLTQLPQLSGGVPQGYLRLLIFNRDSALIEQQVQQLTHAALNSYDTLRVRVIVPQDGYVSAYVGNGSDVDVFFDDVTVEHRPGVQVQEVEYDPAGLELAGLAPASPGIKGLNNYRFNGKELQQDLGLNWNHQDWRFFDPQLLRWHAVDPELENGQESWTPYSFGYDNAVRFADANGRAPGPGNPPAKHRTPTIITSSQSLEVKPDPSSLSNSIGANIIFLRKDTPEFAPETPGTVEQTKTITVTTGTSEPGKLTTSSMTTKEVTIFDATKSFSQSAKDLKVTVNKTVTQTTTVMSLPKNGDTKSGKIRQLTTSQTRSVEVPLNRANVSSDFAVKAGQEQQKFEQWATDAGKQILNAPREVVK